ncbi:DUF7124 domain-containing protein [Natrinema saccharevitans]
MAGPRGGRPAGLRIVSASDRRGRSSLRNYFETERYVFVGLDETRERGERVPDWAYQSVTEAATAADWRLGTTSSTGDDGP